MRVGARVGRGVAVEGLAPCLAPDDNHAPLERLRVGRHRRHHVFFLVEAPRGADELGAFLARDLAHRELGREVALQDGDVAGRLDWLVEGRDDLLAGLELRGAPARLAEIGRAPRTCWPGWSCAGPPWLHSARFSAMVLPVTVMQSPCR